MTTKLEIAARQALDALEEAYENGFLTGIAGLKTIDTITVMREALAEQAEQEPVAWMAKNGEVCRHGWRKFHAREEDVDRFCTPLYAAPVRTKDLTDDEIWDALTSIGFGASCYEDARAVIAADREKNK